MKLGRFTVEQLNEGQFELFRDGKINRSPVSETDTTPFDAERTLVGINPLYVTDGNHRLLLDAGLGWGLDAGSANREVSNVCSNLDIFGVDASEITHVVLTHLHYDHAAGISYTDEHARTRPAFPNAQCVLQKREWAHAVEESPSVSLMGSFYKLDDLYRLYADGMMRLTEARREELVPGITLIRTGGHTPGHQIVRIADGEHVAYHLGDLIPTEDHINSYAPMGDEVRPLEAKKARVNFLRRAHDEKALLYFYHSLSTKACRLEMDKDENYILREVE